MKLAHSVSGLATILRVGFTVNLQILIFITKNSL